MKKAILLLVFVLVYSLKANSVVLYYYDDSGSAGGYVPYYYETPAPVINPATQINTITFTLNSPVLAEINSTKSEIREEMNYLRDLIANETDPSLRAYYQSKLADYEAQLSTVQAISQAELNAIVEKQSYVLNLLTNILKFIQDTIMSVVRSIR